MKSRIDELMILLKESPDDVFLAYALSLEFISAGETEKGISGLQEIIRTFPDYIPAYHRLGDILFSMGRFQEAANMLKKGIEKAQKGSKAQQEMQALLEMVLEDLE